MMAAGSGDHCGVRDSEWSELHNLMFRARECKDREAAAELLRRIAQYCGSGETMPAILGAYLAEAINETLQASPNKRHTQIAKQLGLHHSRSGRVPALPDYRKLALQVFKLTEHYEAIEIEDPVTQAELDVAGAINKSRETVHAAVTRFRKEFRKVLRSELDEPS